MSVYQVEIYYATCDAFDCPETLGEGEELTEWELKQRLEDECWEIDGPILHGHIYCPEHAEADE